MKILKNTLKISVDEWSDGGDYPNALASGPLPSYKYIDQVEGEVVIELDPEELESYLEDPNDVVSDIPLPREISSVKFAEEKIEGNVITLYVADFDPSGDWQDEDYCDDDMWTPDDE